MQPTGEVPLTGLGSQLPFFKRLIDWLGIGVQAEAREEYKSIVAQYTREKLSEPQTANQVELLHGLNDLMLERIARNRFAQRKLDFNPFPFGVAPSKDSELASSVGGDATAAGEPVLASPLEQSEEHLATSSPNEPNPAEAELQAAVPGETTVAAESSEVAKVDSLVPAQAAPVPKSILDKVRNRVLPFSFCPASD